jgi:NAD+ diphosphatase
MIGCHSLAEDPALTIDTDELEDARWFTRAELLEARAAGEAGTDLLSFPRPFAIAHHLIAWWLDQ